ncbi:MAG: hypothetical protein ACK4NS_11190 [Saprospiraceae bacterium]
MLRAAIRLGLLLVAAILVYNYFFGDAREKEQSRKIFGEAKGLVVSLADLVKSEKVKYDHGKYDKALSELGLAFDKTRDQAARLNPEARTDLDRLEKRKIALQRELEALESEERSLSAQPAMPKKAKRDPHAERIAQEQADARELRKRKLGEEIQALLRDAATVFDKAGQ